MYVVVRARVLQLGAELAMLQDFMDNHLFQGSRKLLFIFFNGQSFSFFLFKSVYRTQVEYLQINETKHNVLYCT
jgi:hypothetical protein